MSWDSFFNHGIDIDGTIHGDILTGVSQEKGTLLFDRDYGAGIRSIENRSGLAREMTLRYNILEFFAKRNLTFIDEELHAITSNESIEISKKNGDMDIVVNYYKTNLTRREIIL